MRQFPTFLPVSAAVKIGLTGMLRKLFQASRGLNSTEINHHFNRAKNGKEKSRRKDKLIFYNSIALEK
jgi:hypothetical protein